MEVKNSIIKIKRVFSFAIALLMVVALTILDNDVAYARSLPVECFNKSYHGDTPCVYKEDPGLISNGKCTWYCREHFYWIEITHSGDECTYCGWKNHTHSKGTKHDAVSPCQNENRGAREYYECTGCGARLNEDESLMALDLNYNAGMLGSPLVHTYASDWSHDASNHWHEAICGHSLQEDLSAHDTNGANGSCSVCSYGLTPPPAPTPTPDPDPAPAESAPEPVPEMTTINIDGATFNSWEEIVANTPALTADKLKKVNESDDDLLHVNIVGKEDKTVPAEAVKAMDKSTITGLHVFIGESDAVTFLNNLDYSKYAGMNFKHEDEVTETGRTIDFTSKGKLNAVLVFHTLIAPNTKANVYKVVDGKEVFLATLQSNENGGFCFAIDELAKYVIKY